MKILLRIIAVLLFIVFFGFAMKNTQEVSLQFFLGYEMRGPLVLLLLGFFVGCLLYTSPSPRDQRGSRMPSSA